MDCSVMKCFQEFFCLGGGGGAEQPVECHQKLGHVIPNSLN